MACCAAAHAFLLRPAGGIAPPRCANATAARSSIALATTAQHVSERARSDAEGRQLSARGDPCGKTPRSKPARTRWFTSTNMISYIWKRSSRKHDLAGCSLGPAPLSLLLYNGAQALIVPVALSPSVSSTIGIRFRLGSLTMASTWRRCRHSKFGCTSS